MNLDVTATVARLREESERRAAELPAEPDDPHREDRLRRAYLAAVGFGRRYQSPDWVQVAPAVGDKLRPYCDALAQHVTAGEGATLIGGVGTGKTHALALIALEAQGLSLPLREDGIPRLVDARYVFSPDLYDALFETRNPDAQERMRGWRDCDLLLLDDADRIYGVDFAVSRFEAFVEHRHGDLRASCISINAGDVFKDPKFARTVDRWRETTTARVEFGNKSRRGA